MISTIATLILFAAPAPAIRQNSASQLVSKMLQYYSDAPSLTGNITLTASDGAGRVRVDTTIQYQKPSLIYIRQVKSGSNPMQWMIVSDGKYFSYNSPENLPGSNQRLTEKVSQLVPDQYSVDKDGKRVPKYANYDIRQIYAVGAVSLGDRSVPLDVAIGRREDLEHDNLTWVTVNPNGKKTVNGEQGTSIVGKWRPYGNAASDPNSITATYEMVIADDGRLLQYSTFQPMEGGGSSAVLTLTWDVDLKVGGKVDTALFKIK